MPKGNGDGDFVNNVGAIYMVSEELNAERQWRRLPRALGFGFCLHVSEELNAERQWRLALWQ